SAHSDRRCRSQPVPHRLRQPRGERVSVDGSGWHRAGSHLDGGSRRRARRAYRHRRRRVRHGAAGAGAGARSVLHDAAERHRPRAPDRASDRRGARRRHGARQQRGRRDDRDHPRSAGGVGRDESRACRGADGVSARERILELDRRFLWHPYTPMGPYLEGPEPLVLERASGARFYDANGKSYIDANSSWWCAALGHDHPRLVAALTAQLSRMPHVPLAGITHAPAAELAAALVARAPSGLSRVFYSDDGSTAVEVAMKLCLQYWHQNGRPERTRFVALEGAFHGETLGATALGGVETFR